MTRSLYISTMEAAGSADHVASRRTANLRRGRQLSCPTADHRFVLADTDPAHDPAVPRNLCWIAEGRGAANAAGTGVSPHRGMTVALDLGAHHAEHGSCNFWLKRVDP